MTSKERLDCVFRGETPDRLPIIGGWLPYIPYLTEIAGASREEYRVDPKGVALKAYKNLHHDGLIQILLPSDYDDYRIVNEHSFVHSGSDVDFDDFVEMVQSLPDAEQYENAMDFDTAYENLKNEIASIHAINPEIVYMPAQWGLGSYISWYNDYGYENFFMLIATYPDLARKLLERGGAKGHFMSRVVAKAIKEGIYPYAVHMGEDICTQRGPMVSAEFLEKYYAPTLTYGLEPLREANCRAVWHSDGDIRQIIPLLIDSGIGGFQGFQPECGVNLELILRYKPKNWEKFLIFGTISVTSELPKMNTDEVRAKIRQDFEHCKGKADYCLFTSSSFGPDIPIENIYAMYDEAVKLHY